MKGGYDIQGDDKLDSYQQGLVYLVKKGLSIKNCIVCKFYKYNEYYSKYICTLYKVLGARFPKQSMANTCPRYELNQELISHPLSELEEGISEVPM